MTGKRLKYITAFLNTKICEWYFTTFASTSGVGTRRWIKVYVEQICIPKIIPLEIESRICLMVDQIQFAKTNNVNTANQELEIEKIFSSIFNFSDEELQYLSSWNN